MGMNRVFKSAVAVLVLAVSLAGPVAAEPLEDALAAYEKGDYATAMVLLRPLANQGSVGAALMIGGMYDDGEGVPQDYAEAMRWVRLAADHGDAFAQFALGAMYEDGKHTRGTMLPP
jgi:uncharacterized protein